MGDRYHNMFKKKETITKKISKKLPWDQKIKLKNFDFFSLYKKWNKKLCISEKIVLLKVLFIKIKKPININEVDIEEIVLSHKKSYGKD